VERDAIANHYFLVKIWVETRQVSAAVPLVRALAKDLDDGSERYVKSRAELLDFIDESLARAGRKGWRWQGEDA
jgi:hypothetical protein